MAAAPPAVAADVPAPVNGAPPPLPGPITAAEAGNNDLAPPSSDSPYRVLIVEDDRAQALFAQSVLHGAGMQAIVHSDADGALQAIKEHRPDLILMDLHLPGLDGMRLTALIRQQPGLQLLPIVFLSGDPDPERQFEVLDSGADDYLSKPIRPRHLIAAVANRIRRARARRRPCLVPAAHRPPAIRKPACRRAITCCSSSTPHLPTATAAACSSSKWPARWACASAMAMPRLNG